MNKATSMSEALRVLSGSSGSCLAPNPVSRFAHFIGAWLRIRMMTRRWTRMMMKMSLRKGGEERRQLRIKLRKPMHTIVFALA